MHANLLAISLLLASIATALPVLSPLAASEVATSPTFYMIANVTSPASGLNPQLYHVAVLHIAAGADLAILAPPDSASLASAFYQNGTSDELSHLANNILTTVGSAQSTFFGFQVPSRTSPADNVEVSIGNGSTGARVGSGVDHPASDSSPPYVQYSPLECPKKSQFYACNAALPEHGGYVKLYWRDATTVALPKGCADVALIPQCAGDFRDGSSRPFAQRSFCYADVPAALARSKA